MEEAIFLKDCLEQMKKRDARCFPIPFSIAVRTFQSNSKTGGKMNRYEKAELLMALPKEEANSVAQLRRRSSRRAITPKNPNHFQNMTRNIRILPSGEIKKINIRFIIEFNGKKVVY